MIDKTFLMSAECDSCGKIIEKMYPRSYTGIANTFSEYLRKKLYWKVGKSVYYDKVFCPSCIQHQRIHNDK